MLNEETKKMITELWQKEEDAAKEAVIKALLDHQISGMIRIELTKFENPSLYTFPGKRITYGYRAHFQYPAHDEETKKLRQALLDADKKISSLQDTVKEVQDNLHQAYRELSGERKVVDELSNHSIYKITVMALQQQEKRVIKL